MEHKHRTMADDVLADMVTFCMRLVQNRGLPADQALEVATELADTMRDHWAGQQVYFRKLHEHRQAAIAAAFTGDNHADVCRQFSITRQRLYQILALVRTTRRRA